MANKSNKIIFWDWNGTLLNDVRICIESINCLLRNRDLPLLDLSSYRDVFAFPVKDYYEKLGFDFNAEPFEVPAWEFMDRYIDSFKNADLHINTKETLEFFQKKGYNQYIISAMQHEMLVDSVEKRGIINFFNEVLGIKDIYAGSKLHIAGNLLGRLDIRAEEVVFVGDTLHDFEVALHFGFKPLLLTHGHQSKKRLESTGAIVKDNFSQITTIIEDHFKNS